MSHTSHMPSSEREQAIAIIAMSGRFPGASNIESFWSLIENGHDAITRDNDLEPAPKVSSAEMKNYLRARGILSNVEHFDASFFDLTPAEASLLDPQQRIWLEIAWEALERGGYAHQQHDYIVGVWAGSFLSNYLYSNLIPNRASLEDFLRMNRPQSFALMVHNDPAFLPSRTAYKFNLRGPAINVQTACSTSLVTVCLAVQSLLNFEVDLALAGGVCIALPQNHGYFFQEGSIASRDGVCRPYDHRACGTVFSNGAGAVLLKRLADAENDGDPILAVIRGAAINNDGHTKVSYAAPSVQGQAEVITTAHTLANIDAATIEYVEGHGTGTPIGDPIEIEALTRAFRQSTQKNGFCCLGSAKGNIGHLDAAAGIAGLIRSILALQHRVFPPTAHFQLPNPELRLDSTPFYVLREKAAWPSRQHPRRAGVSAFGIGGTNAHVVLEEYLPAPNQVDVPVEFHEDIAIINDAPSFPLLVSAGTATALQRVSLDLAEWAESKACGRIPLKDLAITLGLRKKAFSERRVVSARNWKEAIAGLKDMTCGIAGRALEGKPRLIFLLPGQGSLPAGKFSSLLLQEKELDADLQQVCRLASDLAAFDFMSWFRDPQADAQDLEQDNARAQLAVFCFSTALAQWLARHEIKASGYLGHSLGEWTAAHLAGILSLEDCLQAVYHRGRLMQQTGPGAALIVRACPGELSVHLPSNVSIACINGPKLCLVSGSPEAITGFREKLRELSIAAQSIPIRVAVHSPAMDAIIRPLGDILKRMEFRKPTNPILSPATGAWLHTAEAIDSEFWARQPRACVQFASAISCLGEESLLALEVGTGSTLTALLRSQRANRQRQDAIPLLPIGNQPYSAQELQRAPARLWVRGFELDLLKPVIDSVELSTAAPILPTYPFERQRYWRDAPPSDDLHLPPSSEIESSTSSPESNLPCAENPQTNIENKILACLTDVSGIAPANIDPIRSLQSQGMESLLLVQFAEHLNKSLGTSIGIAQIVEFNSVKKLASLLAIQTNDSTKTDAPPQIISQRSGSFRGLVRLREGDNNLPFFLINGDRADEFLLPWLPSGQAFYGFVHQGSDGEFIHHKTVESLAEQCFIEWRAIHKTRSCILGGHSFGGLVAYHLAHLMIRNGIEVKTLIILDSFHPRAYGNSASPGLQWVRRSAYQVRARITYESCIAKAQLYIARRGLVPSIERPRYIHGVYELAARKYHPLPINVDTLLFVAAKKTDPSPEWLPNNGWLEKDVGKLTAHVVEGDHLSIVRNENAFTPIARTIGKRFSELRVNFKADKK